MDEGLKKYPVLQTKTSSLWLEDEASDSGILMLAT